MDSTVIAARSAGASIVFCHIHSGLIAGHGALISLKQRP